MEVYLVGGAVRDFIMGIEPKDKDYVVVGSTPEEMLELGYKQVGCDFPVFLSPETGDEYALARTEKKNGVGYQGFDCYFGPEVTLEEDLMRRDLTINSMAMDSEGNIIDPFGGQHDILNKTLKHTSKHFQDDPVRVLRLFRLLSRFGSEWKIDSVTLCLSLLVIYTQFKDITSERVWLELEKTLSEPHPELFFGEIEDLWGSSYWFTEFQNLKMIPQRKDHHPERWTGLHTRLCLKSGVKLGCTPKELFAILCHDFGKAPCYKERGNLHGHEENGVPLVEGFCERLKAPRKYKDLAVKVCRYHTHCHKVFELKPKTIMKLFDNLGAFQNGGGETVRSFVKCCEADSKGRFGFEDRNYPQARFLVKCWEHISKLETKKISEEYLEKGLQGKAVGDKIRTERINRIREVKHLWKQEN